MMMMMEESPILIPGLNHDAAFEILIRIPPKVLVRLSCLNKSWYIFIFSNSTYFARSNQAATSRRPTIVWLQTYWTSSSNFGCCRTTSPAFSSYLEKEVDPTTLRDGCFPMQRPYPCERGYVSMISCCDGVFCLHDVCIKNCWSDAKIFLWNPTLRQCNLLPGEIGIGYKTIAVGFGFDSLTQDYIVAKVQYIPMAPETTGTIYKISIYTLSSYSWTTIHCEILDDIPKFHDIKDNNPRIFFGCFKCVILKGYLYWLVYRKNQPKEIAVEYIHVSGDNHGDILIPDFVTLERRIRLDLCGGHLSISGFSAENKYEHWLMPEANSNAQWVKHFQVPMDSEDSKVAEAEAADERNSNAARRVNLFDVPSSNPSLFIDKNQATDVTAGGRTLAFDPAYLKLDAESNIERIRAVLYNPMSRRVDDTMNNVRANSVKLYVADNFVHSLVSVKSFEEISEEWTKKKRGREKNNRVWVRLLLSVGT